MSKTRFLVAALLAVTLALPSAPVFAGAPLQANSLFKGESTSAVYWYASNGKRYVFPTENTYYSWFPDFSTVRTISDAEVAAIQIGGNVTYRPGAKMLKITTDPRTYVVARGGFLRQVTSEAAAQSLYGSNWATKVHDLPDAFFINYKLSSANVSSASDFNVSNEYNGVNNPSDSIFFTGSEPTPTPSQPTSVTLVSNKTLINEGDSVTLSGTVYNKPSYNYRLEIVDVRNGTMIRSCDYSVTICDTTVNVYRTQSGQTNAQYYMVLKRSSDGAEITRQYSQLVNFNGASYDFKSGSSYLSESTTSIANGQTLTLTGTVTNVFVPDNQIRMEFYRDRDGQLMHTCYDSRTCNYSFTMNESVTNIRYYLLVKSDANEVIPAAYTNRITITNPENATSTTASLVTSVDKTTINAGDSVTFTAQYANAPVSTYYKTEIMDQYGNVKTTCTQSAYCYFTSGVTSVTNAATVTYQAVIKNQSGVIIASKSFPTITLTQTNLPTTLTGTATMTVNPSGTRPANTQVTLTAAVTNYNVPTANLTIYVWAGTTPQVIKTCTGVATCSAAYNLGAAGNSYPFYTSVISTNGQNTLVSPTAWVTTN